MLTPDYESCQSSTHLWAVGRRVYAVSNFDMQNAFRAAEPDARDPYIDLVGKIVKVVETLAEEPDGLSLRDLASRTGYIKSSVHRMLSSLKRHGYIEQERNRGLYRLGVQFAVIGRSVRHGLIELSRPRLRELVERFDETVYLAVLRNDSAFFAEVQETTRDLRLVGPLGAHVHYHATAAGKAIAAFLPPDRALALLRRGTLPRVTDRTLTDPDRVRQEWATVMRRGYAVNNEETIIGAIFLGAPVFDARRAVCGSLSIGIPKARYSGALGREIAAGLIDACQRTSAALAQIGYVHESETQTGQTAS
jgi:DNA-binding IclR family transcriptional regulator